MTDKSRYAGMTVNERLIEANLLKEFDHAERKRDREQMFVLLQNVEMTYDQVVYTADTILANPSRYGY